jgi:hypothetical protein
MVERNAEKTDNLLAYSFDGKWIVETSNILYMLEKIDKNFPNIFVIVSDSIDNMGMYLQFNKSYSYELTTKNNAPPKKRDYIRSTTKEERDYLHKVFMENFDEVRFSARNGNYELFYPYRKNGKIIVLYLSDYQRYGKIGS